MRRLGVPSAAAGRLFGAWARRSGALVLAVVAAGAPAAVLPQDDSLLQPTGRQRLGLAGEQAGAGADSALERALRVQALGNQRNLDLLLETRGAGETAVEPRQRRRQDLVTGNPAQSAVPGQAGASAPIPRLVALAAESGLSASTGNVRGAAGSAVSPPGRREWLGAVGSVGSHPGLMAEPGRIVALQGELDDARVVRREPGQASNTLSLGLREAVAFLREHRVWVLGAVAVLGLGMLLARALQQARPDRGAPAAERVSTRGLDSTSHAGLYDLPDAPVVRRHRRRSSRRI